MSPSPKADLAVALALVRAFIEESLDRGDTHFANASSSCWAFVDPEGLADQYDGAADGRPARGAYDGWFVEAFALIDVPKVRSLCEWDASVLQVVLDVVYWLIADMEDQMQRDEDYFAEIYDEYVDDLDRLDSIAQGHADADDLTWLAEEHVRTQVIPRVQFRAGYLTGPYNHLDSWVPTADLSHLRRRVALELWWALRRHAELWMAASLGDDVLLGRLSHGLAADGERLTGGDARRIADSIVELMGRVEEDSGAVQSPLDHHVLVTASRDLVERLGAGMSTVPDEVLEVVGGVRPSQAELDRAIAALTAGADAPVGVLTAAWFGGPADRQ